MQQISPELTEEVVNSVLRQAEALAREVVAATRGHASEPSITEGAPLRRAVRSAFTPTGRPGAGLHCRSTSSTGGLRRATAPHRQQARC